MNQSVQAVRNQTEPDSSVIDPRTAELFAEHQHGIYKRTDRMFAGLMLFQWLAGVGAAIWISPRTWSGTQSHIHFHVFAAVVIGGAITILPVWLAWKRPGQTITRHVIAVGQMLTSALLIHLTGGRIETHFHIFGSLAFLAIYRDWRVLISATIVVAADHFVRGIFWPQSVFGVLSTSSWRWVEHAGWVVFEDFFLMISIHQSLEEMRLISERQSRLEAINKSIEQLVQSRTRELEQTHKELVETSRLAGMAEVATSVLHNVGNVLNSINVSTGRLSDQFKKSTAGHLGKAAGLMREHAADLGDFMTKDAKGRQLPSFLERLAEQLAKEQTFILEELGSMAKNVDHIKDIVAMQQSYGHVSGVLEMVRASDVVEDALRMNASALTRHDVRFFREYDEHVPEINVEKHKVLQILVNLIRNAKEACAETGLDDKRVTVRVTNGGDKVRIVMMDNGVGIPSENLARIFNHGFTTKKKGHGFGLHSGALAARAMGGSLIAQSDGPRQGAAFTLELPCRSRQGTVGAAPL